MARLRLVSWSAIQKSANVTGKKGAQAMRPCMGVRTYELKLTSAKTVHLVTATQTENQF